jgi:hypothetical protein
MSTSHCTFVFTLISLHFLDTVGVISNIPSQKQRIPFIAWLFSAALLNNCLLCNHFLFQHHYQYIHTVYYTGVYILFTMNLVDIEV